VPFGGPRLHGRLSLGFACAYAGFIASPAYAAGLKGGSAGRAQVAFHRDDTPLPADLTGSAHTSIGASVGSGAGNAALHMLVGLAIVCALILGLYKLLRRSAAKSGKIVRDDGWIQVVSSTPLAPSRSLHLVRVGEEIVLIGSSEQGVTPIRVYGPEEAARLGVDSPTVPPAGGRAGGNPGFGTALVESLKRMTAR
jgi:flagellar protein FliO/FliZ